MLMTQAQYARHRGVTEQAVHSAVKEAGSRSRVAGWTLLMPTATG
jgi:hypothetical protein